MKHRLHIWFIGFAMMAAGAACAWAEAVTPEQAQQVAVRFMAERHSARQGMPGKAPAVQDGEPKAAREWKTRAVFDATDQKGRPYLYAVRDAQENGYVIVSGDDRFAEVLGYSESGSLDEAEMPDNMRAWLQEYIAEMRYWDSIGYAPSSLSSQPSEIRTQMSAIPPLIETQWNQGAPFNNLCPLDNNDKRSVTGCVATAVAQIVNFHMQHYNAPTAIIADIPAYTTKTQGLSVAGVAAGTSLPDKSLLLNSYSGTPTEVQKTAVAQLMLYCGTAVQMNYGSSASSASSSAVPKALINYFGFDATARQEKRTNYTYAGWKELIYSELATSRPVYYSGGSSGSAHAFVVDGCDDNGLFHVNWGWGGSSDGYFALSVLNPDDDAQIGASLSSDGYTMDQCAVIGVQLNSGETIDQPVCLTTSNLRVEGQEVIYAAFNHTGATYSFNAGIGFIDDAGKITRINHTTYDDLKDNYGYSSVRRTVPTNKSYANQTKKIVPISRKAAVLIGKWYTGSNPDIYYYTAKYDANGVPTLTAHPTTLLRVDTTYITTARYIYEKQSIKVQVTNNGDELYGKIYLFATLADTLGKPVTELGLTALENSTQTVAFEWHPEETGTYRMAVALDNKGENVLSESTVTIREDASVQGKKLAIMSYSFENQDNSTFEVDEATGIRSMDVYGSQLKGMIKVRNMGSTTLSNYQVRVFVEKYDEQKGKYITGTSSTYYSLNLSPGATTNLGIDRTLTTDCTYRICLVLRNLPLTYLDDRYVVHMRSSQPVPTKAEEVVSHEPSAAGYQKMIRNGQLVILRNGKQYTVQGQLIR